LDNTKTVVSQFILKKIPIFFTKFLYDDNKPIKTMINNPNMYLKIFINDVEFYSDTWSNNRYIYDPQWSATLNVPDDQEFVDIKIQLFGSIGGDYVLYDLSGNSERSESGYQAEIEYSIKTGHWTGDDQLSDPSGYGRLCGCDDGSIYQKDRDCELWFNIYQNDYDNDGIPYWAEVNTYGSNPNENDYGDADTDGIPLEWEWKWGYNPFISDDHGILDPDGDSINNIEEYKTSEWYSDPFRKDVFVELDVMENGPNGEIIEFPYESKELITTAFNRQNIVFHLDDDKSYMGGHERIPFIEKVNYYNLNEDIYQNYFLHGDENNWRRGVFHYGLVVYKSDGAAGYMFRANSFQISSSGHEYLLEQHPEYDRNVVYASAYMHELGHTFGFWRIPGHTRSGGPMYWLWVNSYKSCMNYAWMYILVDYSDGSRRPPDINDWNPNRMRFNSFESEW
jgi:hypothetical protein